jgi:hypothetical protein
MMKLENEIKIEETKRDKVRLEQLLSFREKEIDSVKSKKEEDSKMIESLKYETQTLMGNLERLKKELDNLKILKEQTETENK